MKFWNTGLLMTAAILAAGTGLSKEGSVDGEVVPPVPIYKVSPTHPEPLYSKAIEGEAVILVTVDMFGSVRDAEVESATHEEFGPAALQAATEWVFEPATLDGMPIEIRVKLPFAFDITFEHKMNVEMGREIFVELKGPIIPSSELDKTPLPSYVPPFSNFYPESFRSTGKSAAVNLEFVISPKGEVLNPRILSITTEGFEEAALKAVSSMKYRPVMVDGKAVYVSMIRPIQLTE